MKIVKSIIYLKLSIIGLILPSAVWAASISVTPKTDTVLPGSVRSVYPKVLDTADVSVSWSATGGTLVNSTGYTTWTAPATPGSYTITATSIADNSQSTTTVFIVATSTVRMDNIPAHAVAFRNQPVVIQSVLWGSVNNSVSWASSGGVLTGSGREVVFSAASAGTYAVTATSLADPSKSATTTIKVTSNLWPGVGTSDNTEPVDCTAVGSGTTYEVTNESEMDGVPWTTLGAGDTVRIHAGVVYHKQILISTSGTNAEPIRVCGVPDGNGNLPELNGANATAKAGSDYGNAPWSIQNLGGIVIYNDNGAYYGPSSPRNIIIEGLKITGYNINNSFYDLSNGSALTPYDDGAACVWIQHGSKISVRGNDISYCGNGLFTMSQYVESRITRNLLIEGNHFHHNGVVGSESKHQNYLQSFGLVVQGNYYDFRIAGALGSQMKTRSVQQFIRYNYFEAGARMLDMVEVEDAPALVYPWLWTSDSQELPYNNFSDVVANHEAYQDRFIYGNILDNFASTTTAWLVHGSADNDQTLNPGGTLYFYNNTVYTTRIDAEVSTWRHGLIDFGPYYNFDDNSVWPAARLTNNVIYIRYDGAASRVFSMNRNQADRVFLEKNWVSPAWGTGNTAGGDGTGISATLVNPPTEWQGGRLTTQVYGIASLIGEANLPLDPTSFIPNAGGPLVGAAVSLPDRADELPPLMQYSVSAGMMLPRDSFADLGAVSADADPSDGSAPTAPGGFTATPASASQINLSWSASTDNVGVAGYQLYRNSTSSGNFIATSTGSSYSSINLTASTLYQYFIRAFDASSNFSQFVTASVTTLAAQVVGGGTGGGGSGSGGGASAINTTATSTIASATSSASMTATSSGSSNQSSSSTSSNLLPDEAEVIAAHDQFVVLSEAEKTIYKKIVGLSPIVLTDQNKISLALFIHDGTLSTKLLGAGERAGAVGSYFTAFGALPGTIDDWRDVIKIGNGRWPKQTSAKAEAVAEKIFKTIYLRAPKRKENKYDNNAVSVIAYGLRPAKRNLNSEKAAIKSFKYIFKRAPSKANDWDVVRAIAYSGAKR